MFEALTAKYRLWAPAAHIYGVVMQSAHPTVFSSGGDLKTLHEWSEQGARGAIREFYRAAYTHVWLLEKFIRPNVPLINGLVLGGGIGITLYGTHCVAGEGYRFGMPQVGIGFLPDIGGTYFLPRLLGWTGLYLALTGRIIGPAEAYRQRLVSHTIPAAHFPVIKDALSDNHPIDRLLDGLHRDPGEGELVRHTPLIDRAFCRAFGRSDPRPARRGTGRRRSVRRGDRGDDPRQVADLAQDRLQSVSARKVARPRPERSSSNSASPRTSSAATTIAKGSPRGSPAKGAPPTGNRPRLQRWTMRRLSGCLPRPPRTNLSLRI